MNKILRNIFLVAVAALYIFSTMGYGVHKCSSEGTASLILLCGVVPCESAHSGSAHSGTHSDTHLDTDSHECGCCHNDDCGNSHDKDCCSTNVYKVSHDQAAAETDIDIAPLASDVSSLMADMYKILSATGQSVCNPSDWDVRDCVYEASLAVLCTFLV